MRLPVAIAAILELGILVPTLVGAQGETKIHEKGRCAIRGHCGKQSIFGGELPCPDNDLARQPDDTAREKLVNICGSKWSEGPVCCREEQVRKLLPLVFTGLHDGPLLLQSRADYWYRSTRSGVTSS